MESASIELANLEGLSVAELKALLHEQHAQLLIKNEELVAKDALIQDFTAQIDALKLQILKLRRMQFGNSSEKRAKDIEQLELLVEQLESASALRSSELAQQSDSRPPARAPKPRREFPEHLPLETRTIMPRESSCPDCGGELKTLGEDSSDMLELEEVRFKVIRQVRPKRACACCDTIVQAPAPTRPIERGMVGPGLLAHILVSKYSDHIPLYRQSEIYARQGVPLDRSLMAQWVGNIQALLRPLTDALYAHVFAADVLHADSGARTRARQDQDWQAVDLRARRATRSGPGCAGGVVFLFSRSEGRASAAASGKLCRYSASRRVCGLFEDLRWRPSA
jgi:transposase